jgi:hypothetical protein
MKKFTKYITPLLFACVAISCTDLADGINVDPNALSVSDAQAKNIFQSALLQINISKLLITLETPCCG